MRKHKYVKKKTDPRMRRLDIRATILGLVAVIIFLGGNYAFQLGMGKRDVIDITPSHIMTTGEVTDALLKGLDQKVDIYILDSKPGFQTYNSFMIPLLDTYEQRAGGKVKVTYFDISEDPSFIKKVDPDGSYDLKQGDVVVKSYKTGRLRVLKQSDLIQSEMDPNSGRFIQTGFIAESALSGAINFVTAKRVPTIYYTDGHGEPRLERDYKELFRLINNNNYVIHQLSALTKGIPDDAAMVMILDPKQDLAPGEVEVFKSYVERGGSLLVAVGSSPISYENLNKVLDLYNIRISDDRIQEGTDSKVFKDVPSNFLGQVPVSKLAEKAFPDSVLVLGSRAIVTADKGAEWIGTEPVVTTDDKGRLQKQDGSGETSSGDEGSAGEGSANSEASGSGEQDATGLEGVRNVAMLSENSGVIKNKDMASAKALVIGSASVFRDDVFSILGETGYNYTLAYKALHWLTNQSADANKLMISTKPMLNYSLGTFNGVHLTLASLVSIILVPLVFIVIAIVVYRKRRDL